MDCSTATMYCTKAGMFEHLTDKTSGYGPRSRRLQSQFRELASLNDEDSVMVVSIRIRTIQKKVSMRGMLQ